MRNEKGFTLIEIILGEYPCDYDENAWVFFLFLKWSG